MKNDNIDIIVEAVKASAGACSVGTIHARLYRTYSVEEVAAAIKDALRAGLLMEHPTLPNIYGLPAWYRNPHGE